MARRSRCSSVTDCLFNSNSSTTLVNIGPSLPVTVCLLLVTTFFSLSVSRFLVADSQAHITVLVPRVFLVVLMSIAVIFAVAFFVLPTASIVARVRPSDTRASLSRGRLLATFVRQNVVVVGIILFYVISCVPDLLRVINTSMCWQAWTQCSAATDPDICTAHHVELFYYSLRVILTSLMVLVCWSFRTVVLRRNLVVTLGLATFAAAMSCLWFDTWVTEVAENLKHARQLGVHQTQVSNDSHSYNSTEACQTHNTAIDNLLDKYEQYFYPCTFELALLVVHCVVHWYTSSQTSPSSSSLPARHRQQPTETTALLGYRSTGVNVTSPADVDDVITAESRDGVYTMLLVVMTTLVNIVYCLLTFLAVYAQLYYKNTLFYHVRVWYETFYRALMTSLLIAGLVTAAGTTKHRQSHHSGVEYLVLFTSWAPVIKSLMTIIAYSCGSRDWITTSLRTANVSGQTIAVLHVAIQTVFVYYVRNLRCDEPLMSSAAVSDQWRRRRSQFRALLLVIVLSDVSFWVNSSFEINMAYGYSYLSNFVYHWVPLVSLIVPVAVFYYFNCALLCLDVFLNC